MSRPALALAFWLLLAEAAAAHSRCIPLGLAGPQTIDWRTWSWDPLIIGNLTLIAGAYGLGVKRMWRGAGSNRGVSTRHIAAFALGLAVLVLALLSPLDALSEQLAWAHMVQHMLIMVVAAPLVVAGRPLFAVRRSLAATWRDRLNAAWRKLGGYWLLQAPLAWALYALTLWIWHLPALYGAALREPLVHELQHLAFFASSCFFWGVVLHPVGRRLGALTSALYLFTTTLHATLLGVFMALAPRAWYPEYLASAPAWGLSALEDQQLAGFIMWMPACFTYAIVAALAFAVYLQEPGSRRSAPGSS